MTLEIIASFLKTNQVKQETLNTAVKYQIKLR